MERSGNFYKAIRLGYILISILIGCMAYNSLYEWQEIEALELGNKKIDELRKAVDGLKQEIEKVKSVVYASKEVLNLEEAAMFLGISKSSLYKMTHNHVIPYFRPNNKMVYFEKSELLKWLRQNPIASQAQISEEANAIMRNLARKE